VGRRKKGRLGLFKANILKNGRRKHHLFGGKGTLSTTEGKKREGILSEKKGASRPKPLFGTKRRRKLERRKKPILLEKKVGSGGSWGKWGKNRYLKHQQRETIKVQNQFILHRTGYLL